MDFKGKPFGVSDKDGRFTNMEGSDDAIRGGVTNTFVDGVVVKAMGSNEAG